jgi:hypothetical protein
MSSENAEVNQAYKHTSSDGDGSSNIFNAKAEINPGYQYKFLLIGIIALVIGLYHFYDPIFKYPGIRPISQARAKIDSLDISDGEKQRQWKEITEKNGWSEEIPYTEAELTTNTIYSYFIGFLFTFFVGIPCMITGLRCLGQWIAADETGLSNAKGQAVSYDQIQSIDKAKWEKKGIAKLLYADGDQEKTFVIDDLKLNRLSARTKFSTENQNWNIDRQGKS